MLERCRAMSRYTFQREKELENEINNGNEYISGC